MLHPVISALLDVLPESDVCTQCDVLQPVLEFGPDPDKATGRKTYCRTCDAGRHRVRRDATRARAYRPHGQPDAEPGVVYRAYDADGALLYIGETNNLYRRLYWPGKGHADTSAWFPLAETLTVEVYQSKSEARTAEYLALECGRPPFNRKKGSRRTAYDPAPGFVYSSPLH